MVSALLLAPSALAAPGDIPGRGFLPDNRGWEEVTPAEKEGTDILLSEITHASLSGDRLYFKAVGALAGAPGSISNQDYLAERGQDGNWLTQPLNPPFANHFGPLGATYAFDPELSTALIAAESPPQVLPDAPQGQFNFYLRNSLDRTFSWGIDQEQERKGVNDLPPFVSWTSSDLRFLLLDPIASSYFADDPSENAVDTFYFGDTQTGTVERPALIPDESTPDPSDEILVNPQEVGDPEAGAGAGIPGSSPSWKHNSVSDDGSRIFFTVSPFLGFSQPNRGAQLYARIDQGMLVAHTIRLSAPEPGAVDESPGQLWASWYRTASSNGSRVFFTSCEALTADAVVDTSKGNVLGECAVETDDFGHGTTKSDLYLYDLDAEDLTDLSVGDPDGADVRGFLGASEDGSRAYFVGYGDLVPGASAGEPNLYFWQQGVGIVYIATLSEADERVWAPGGNQDPQTTRESESRVTPDGRYLAFSSQAALEPGFDSGGHSQVYLYDAVTDQLRCASCIGSEPAIADTTLRVQESDLNFYLGGGRMFQRNLTADGHYVFVQTAEPLVPEDQNGVVDVYSYDSVTENISLISGGDSEFRSVFANASADGSDVFFKTREQLAGADTDNLVDIYDARIDGGVPDPAGPPVPCVEDEACRGPATPPPPDPKAGSTTVSRSSNRHRTRACPKGTHKAKAKKGAKKRCLKNKRHRKHTSNRAHG